MTHKHHSVVAVRAYRLTVSDEPWHFARENAEAVAAHWQQRLQTNPAFFNGTVHLLGRFEIAEGQFTGELLRTDFASFLYWRDHGYPDKTMCDCFGSALLRSSDAKIILGRQAPGRINSGLTYCPGGFIDQRDVGADGTVDFASSVAREIVEELGYAPDTFTPSPGAYLTFDGQLLSVAIDHVSHLDADTLLRLARDHIAAEADSELEDVVAVAAVSDVQSLAMPGFMTPLLHRVLAAP